MHTNDTLSSLDSIGSRSTLVRQMRSEFGQDNVLLVDSGNVFTGSLYFTVTQGQADLWFMNYLEYAAMGLGHHEFDKGPGVLADFISQARFPVLCANFDFSQEPALAEKIQPWVVLQRGTARYGLFSLTTPETAQLSQPGPHIVMRDPFEAAQKAVTRLQEQGVNRIITLSQLGWQKDLDLANQVQGIDVIIGGDSGTVPENYPSIVNQSAGPTLIVQAGKQGSYLGQLKVSWDQDGRVHGWDGSRLISVDQNIPSDPACTAQLEEYRKPIQDLLGKNVGKTLVDLDGDRSRLRSGETNLGNLVTDAMLDRAKTMGRLNCHSQQRGSPQFGQSRRHLPGTAAGNTSLR